MADQSREMGLNDGYYGPSIPPGSSGGEKETPLRRRRRRTMAMDCTPYNLLCNMFRFVTIALIVVGVIILVVWLANQPSSIKVYVDSAAISNFTLLPGNLLSYNVTIDMSIRNPNKRLGIEYERFRAAALYQGLEFGNLSLPHFHQDKKNTKVLRLGFHGLRELAGVNATEYAGEEREGEFGVEVSVTTRVRLKMVVVNSVRYRPQIDCRLRIPAPGSLTAAPFQPTQCHADDFS